MSLIEALKKNVRMEIRPTSRGLEYLEAVITVDDLRVVDSVLTEHLGAPVKGPGQEASLPEELQDLVDLLGGLRIEQSFYCKQEGRKVIYAALWPWRSDPRKITLKSGVMESLPKA